MVTKEMMETMSLRVLEMMGMGKGPGGPAPLPGPEDNPPVVSPGDSGKPGN